MDLTAQYQPEGGKRMKKNKEREKEDVKRNLPTNTPPIVSPQEWEAAPSSCL
jgi:hypothetical protein